MAQITLGDVTGTAEVQVDDSSLLGKSQLSSVISGTSTFIQQLPSTIDKVTFQSATLGATIKLPSISLDTERSISLQPGVNCVLTRYAAADTPLLGNDPTVPEIDIAAHDFWLSFELDGTLTVTGALKTAAGFGVKVSAATALKLSAYKLFGAAPYPTLQEAIRETLNELSFVTSATDFRNQKPGTVLVADQSGTFTLSGSYSFPFSVNQLALAGTVIPFKIELNPSLDLTVGGSVAVTGECTTRAWKVSDSQLLVGLFRKKGTTFTASFSASAGLAANAGNTDLVQAFFSAIDPTVDLSTVLPKTDPRYAAIDGVLQDSLSQGLNASVNASAASTFGDDAAVVYMVDLTGDHAKTDAALNAAIDGDWTLLAELSTAKELRNVLGTTRESKFTFSVNLLGIFDYESVADFVRTSTVVHSSDGSITVTDQVTAKRITVASEPFQADPQKLRKILYQSLTPTLAYAAAGGTRTANIEVAQSLLIYRASTNPSQLRKDLRLAVAIGQISESQLASVPITSPKPSHVLIDASQDIKGAQALAMFFANVSAGTAQDLDTLKSMGKQVLASLLDPNDTVDQRRIQVLNSSEIWQEMDNNQFPQNSPASYSDWYDITFWANAIHDAAAPLKNALDALAQVPAGADPSTDPNFTRARAKLTKAMGEISHDTHAAFEQGWPIAIMYRLAGGGTQAKLTASWDGKIQLPVLQQVAMQPNALAKRIAGRSGAALS